MAAGARRRSCAAAPDPRWRRPSSRLLCGSRLMGQIGQYSHPAQAMDHRVSPTLDQRIRFCTSSDGARIAYATSGRGPPLVKAANWLSHLELDSSSPVWRHWIRELSRDHTLVRYDERGCGLSDWDIDEFSLDAWVPGSRSRGGRPGARAIPAARHLAGRPHRDRVRHPPSRAREPTHPLRHLRQGSSAPGASEREREERELMLRMIRLGWGKDHDAFRQVFTRLFIPEGTPEQIHWFNELQRVSATPENAARIVRAFHMLDVRDAGAPPGPHPTLVLHGTEDLRIPFNEGRLLASTIPVPLRAARGRNHSCSRASRRGPAFCGRSGLPRRGADPSDDRAAASIPRPGGRRRGSRPYSTRWSTSRPPIA